MRRLIHGLFGAALAALLGAAHTGVPVPAEHVALAAIDASAGGAMRAPEVRAASERTPKAPSQKAARTRRPASAGAAGVLPAQVQAAVGAPVVLIIGGPAPLISLPSECGHCTRAPRPPPIS